MTPPILIPSYRPSGDWRDLEVTLCSLRCYAPQHEVIVGWDGPTRPPGVTAPHRPPGLSTYGAALNWLVAQVTAPEFFIGSDDMVVTPTTLELLLKDVDELRDNYGEESLGFVAARSNAVRLPQRAYGPGSMITELTAVSPVLAWVQREAFEEIGGSPPLNAYSDDIMCWDMVQNNRRHFVSSAYVHHLGERASRDLGLTSKQEYKDAVAWVGANRPQYLAQL